MIILTKVNGVQFVLNCDLIETIEENHDTIIRLMNKNHFTVTEKVPEIMDKIIDFRKKTNGRINHVLNKMEVEVSDEA